MEKLSSSEEEEKDSQPIKKKGKFQKLREQIPEEILKSWEKYFLLLIF